MSTQWWGFTAFHIVDLNYTTFYQIASLFDRYIDMGQRIPWKQYGLIVTIAGAPWARAAWTKCNSQKKTFFTLWQPMKNWLLIIFSCCTYVSTSMRSAFSETLVLLELAYVRQDSQKLSVGTEHLYIMLQSPRNILRTFHHRVNTCTRMTNEQLIFHIYGSHCEQKSIWYYIEKIHDKKF